MKKIVFALQVFSLITVFPAFVVLEMNHGTNGSSEIIRPSDTKETTEGTVMLLSGNFKVPSRNAMPVKIQTTLDRQQCNNPNCTCKKCICGSSCTCNDNKE